MEEKETQTKGHISLQVRKDSSFGGTRVLINLHTSIDQCTCCAAVSGFSFFLVLELFRENQKYGMGDDGRIEIM